VTTTDIRADQTAIENHAHHVDPEHTTRIDQRPSEAQSNLVGAGQTPESTERDLTTKGDASARAQDTAAASDLAAAISGVPLPPDSPNGQPGYDAHDLLAVGGTDTADPARRRSISRDPTPGSAGEPDQPASHLAVSRHASLADPTLALAADVVDDLERTRIANENRLRQLTRDEPDEDGEVRGFGLTEDHPDVARLASIVDGLARIEHEATLNLQRAMRRHPLGPWVKSQKGVGEKQAARLLAAIGDPYWNYLHDRPRTVSELWAYCGLHTLPVGHSRSGALAAVADGATAGSDHSRLDGQHRAVAARRKKGQRANWSSAAKMRAWNIAGSMLKAGNRETYDKRKAATEGRAHAVECVRCGPSGKPAQPGTPWSDAHRHADALRIVSKELLKQLWRAARDIHLGQGAADTQTTDAEVEQP
jgi:hypothetical protein